MSDHEFSCPHCEADITVPADAARTVVVCPDCGGRISIPARGGLMRTPPPAPAPRAPGRSGVVKAGWICLTVAIFLAIVLFFVPIWGFLFVAALILGIIATAQKEKGGLTLLLSSLVAAPLVIISMILLIFVGGCGLVAAGVSKELDRAMKQSVRTQSRIIRVTPPQPATPSTRQPAAELAPPPRQQVVLTDFLEALDRAARPYAAAKTTLQKQAVMDKIRAQAPRLLGNAQVSVVLEVKNVSMNGNKAVTITHTGLPLAAYVMRADRILRIDDSAAFQVNMGQEQALKIMPGQKIVLVADIRWVPYGSAFDQTLMASRLLAVSIAPALPTIGYLQMTRVRLESP